MSSPAPHRPSDDIGRTLRTVGVTVAIQAIHSLAVLAIPVMLPAAASAIGVEARFAGLFTAIVYGTSIIAMLVLASSINRIGPMTLCVFATVSAAAGLALFSGGSLAFLVAAAVLLGLAYGPVTPTTAGILAGRVPQRWFGLVFSLKQTGVPIGFAAAGLVVPLLTGLWGWQRASLTLAGALMIAALLMLALRRAYDGRRAEIAANTSGRLAPLVLVLRHRQLRALAIGSAMLLIPQACLGSFLVAFLMEKAGLTAMAAGGMLSAAQLAGMICRVAFGALADRLKERFTLLAGLGALSACGTAATASTEAGWPLAAVTLACVTYGAGAVGWNGVVLAEFARWSPKGQAAAVSAGATAITYAGAVLGPALFGLAVGTIGYRMSFLAVAAIAGLAGGWFAAEGLRMRRHGLPDAGTTEPSRAVRAVERDRRT